MIRPLGSGTPFRPKTHWAVFAFAVGALVAVWPVPPAHAQAGGEQGGAPAGPPPAPPPPDPRVLAALRHRFEIEPTVAEVQNACLAHFRVSDDTVDGYRTAVAWKGLLPDLELVFNHDFGTNDRTLYDYLYLGKYAAPFGTCSAGTCWPAKDDERTTRAGFTLGVRANFSLGRLVFNPETLDVSSLVGVQEGLLREVTGLYFTRRRLLTSMMLSPPQSPQEQITEEIRRDEMEANLDALTGGYFSREVKKRLSAEETAPAAE